MIELNIGVAPKECKQQTIKNTELSKWVFDVGKGKDLIVWYKAVGDHILTGSKSYPFEVTLVKNSEDGKTYTEIYTRKKLNEAEVLEKYLDALTRRFYDD